MNAANRDLMIGLPCPSWDPFFPPTFWVCVSQGAYVLLDGSLGTSGVEQDT